MVSIQQIAFDNLGPAGSRKFDMGRLNLIYGGNETGKTYLVEFILRSLFREATSWPMRSQLGEGKVTVQGLAEEPVSFSPGGQEKLEDYWEQSDVGLPTNMARLMVVKGAELELSETSPTGLDREVLKAALSSEPLIDRILDRIQATVQAAQVIDGTIEGAQRGEVKARQALRDQLGRLRQLIELVDQRYSGGPTRALGLELEQLGAELEQQQQARRHATFLLRQEREQLERQRSQLPRERLEALERDIDRHLVKSSELERLREKQAQVQTDAEHHPWVKQAVTLWERRGLERAGGGGLALPVAAGGLLMIGLLVGLVGVALNLVPLARAAVGAVMVLSVGAGIMLWASALARAGRDVEAAVEVDQRKEIETEFERRFGRPAGGLSGLKVQEEALRDAQAEFKAVTAAIKEAEADLQDLAANIEALLRELGAGEVAPEGWRKIVDKMKQWDGERAGEIQRIEVRLGELGVDESDDRELPPEVEFSAERLRELETSRERVEQELAGAQRDLDNLKGEIARETGDEISVAWDELLDHLNQRLSQADQDYRTTTARILGQIAVTQVLKRVREEEDEKIRQGLRAAEVGEALQRVTEKYRALDMANGTVSIQSDTASYPLEQLSTGAREQVLLALRMGFASRLAGGQPLFLILDDAFQHSDWERRERLVEQTVRMVQAGWQVTYLTMDDHLSDLFHTAGKRAFGGDYRQHSLES